MNQNITNAKVEVVTVDGKEYIQLEGDTMVDGMNGRIFVARMSLEDVKYSVCMGEDGIRTGDITFKLLPDESHQMVSYTFGR